MANAIALRQLKAMRWLALLLCLTLFFGTALAKEKTKEPDLPPFGVKFGQKFDITEHKSIRRRGNVRSVKLKTADRPNDTEELRAEICDKYGLQFVTWRSYIRSQSAASARHKEIVNAFSKEYGKAKKRRGSVFWKAEGFYVVAKIRKKGNIYQNQIRYFGPKNEPCFEELKNQLQK